MHGKALEQHPYQISVMQFTKQGMTLLVTFARGWTQELSSKVIETYLKHLLLKDLKKARSSYRLVLEEPGAADLINYLDPLGYNWSHGQYALLVWWPKN